MEKMAKKKKFLLVLPLIALPFITLAFWGLGGGKGSQAKDETAQQGINKELPGAQLEDGTLDKMSLYGKSALDAPSRSGMDSAAMAFGIDSSGLYNYGAAYGQYNQVPYSGSGAYGDANEQKVRQRLDELERIMTMQSQAERQDMPPGYGNSSMDNNSSFGQMGRMMDQMSAPGEPDPELQTLDNMLDKIMDIQNPERAKEKIRMQSLENRGVVFAVSRTATSNAVPLLKRADTKEASNSVGQETAGIGGQNVGPSERNGFYPINGPAMAGYQEASAIPAVVHETQTLVSGANLKMRLSENIYVNGILIPAGRFISGQCSLDGERLQIKINGIRYGNYLLPVRLSVFDLDGMAGIRIPGTISRDVAKEGTERALQSMQFMSLDPSIGSQAAGAGVEAAKSLLSKKVRLIKVTVKAGHPVLLYDEQSNKH
ncbi:hypothetical protein D3C71_89690 [compost metagenome]